MSVGVSGAVGDGDVEEGVRQWMGGRMWRVVGEWIVEMMRFFTGRMPKLRE